MAVDLVLLVVLPLAEGEVLGEIHDYTGKLVETVRAPIAGYGLYGPAGPPIRKGDSAMSIAVPIDGLD